MLALTLIACTGAPVDTAAPADTAVDAGLEPPPPSLDAAGVEAELALLLADALPESASLLAHWRDLFWGTTQGCPAITGNFSIAAPFDGCLASDGRTWAGYAVYAEGDDAPVDVDLAADASVTGLDGTTFLGAGQATLTIAEDGAFDWMVVGTWGGATSEDWTEPRPSVSLWAEGTPDAATIVGGLSLDQHAFYLEDVTWDAAECAGGQGGVRVRDPGGWWYHLALECDGCGALTYEGTELGEACTDLGTRIAATVARQQEEL